MSIDLPADLIERLEAEAAHRGAYVSELVRAACENWLALALVTQTLPQPSVTAARCQVCGEWVPFNVVHSHMSSGIENPSLYWSCPACGGACGPGWAHKCPCIGHICTGNGYIYRGVE